ncbi:MAG: hypothetical protein O2820_15045 [Planctomycetota bacterium]|nr:hypothetical protein [Planctomycetota bacterium]MDA1250531.1 hypothetical protein [Planctomycetota bacterium]
MHRVLSIFCFVAGLLAVFPAAAFSTTPDQTSPTIGAILVGEDGTARVGAWTSVSVSVTGPSLENATIEVVTPDPQGHPVTVSKAALLREPQFVQFGRIETWLEVRLISDGKVVDKKRLSTEPDENGERDFTVLRHATPRWLVAGKFPAVDEMSKARDAESTLSKIHIVRLPTDAFPTDSLSLTSYDTVLLSGEFSLSADQAECLDTWVKSGGQLICFLGAEDRVEQFRSSRIANWFDMEIQTKRVSDLGGVEAFVQGGMDGGDSEPLLIGARRVAVASVKLADSVSLDRGGLSGSVLTETARGFGRVTFVGFDMDRKPLSLWGERGSGQFLLKLAGVALSEEMTTQRSGRVSKSGITDLATQFREAVEYLPGLGDRSTLSVLGLVLLYLLIIGPADYFLVHRVLKRPQLTWLTFPAIVVVGALLARSAALSSNGTELRVTQVDLVDIDSSTGFVRESAWCSIYSPQNARYRVAAQSSGKLLPLENDAANGTPKLGWFGMPEENYGGMYRAGGLEIGRPGYNLSERQNGIDNLPIPIWSNRSLTAEMQRSSPDGLLDAELIQSGTGGQLAPASRLTHHFPTPIEDWLIVYGNRAYFPEDAGSENAGIRPGEVWAPLDASGTSQDLAGYLNGTAYRSYVDGRSSKHTRISTTLTDYDSQSRNVKGILAMISLHEHGGGFGYTSLRNFALRKMELSRHLPLNRAVLIGRVSVPATILEIDGKPIEAERHETFVRILIPVQPTELNETLPDLKK